MGVICVDLTNVQFQFQIGAIKSLPVEEPPDQELDSFNSKLVRLKVNVKLHQRTLLSSFNSKLVRLKVYIC